MQGDDYGEDDGQSASGRAAGIMPGGGDRLAVIKRQKRLEMNRESARNRRRRKKMLLETLQKQNDDLVRTNRSLLLSKAALTSRVQTLEQELAIARTTVAQYQLGAAAGGVGATAAGIGSRMGVLPSAHAAAGLAVGSQQQQQQNLERQLNNLQQQQRGNESFTGGPDSLISGTTGSSSDNLNRLMQAQLDHLALQQQQQQLQPQLNAGLDHQQGGLAGSFHSGLGGHDLSSVTNFPFRHHSSLMPHSTFSNESILLRHGLDLQALSQASRDSALGSLLSRHQQQQHDPLLSQHIPIGGEGSERSLASANIGMRAEFDPHQLLVSAVQHSSTQSYNSNLTAIVVTFSSRSS
jgi:hypothetical protein